MNLKDLISRADIDTLQELLGRSTVNLITNLDSTRFNTTKLQQVLLDMYSEFHLLRTLKTRNLLFDMLKKKEATTLLSSLGLQARPDSDIWQQIKNIKLTSKNKKVLCDHFGITDFEESRELKFRTEDIQPDYPLFDHQILASVKVLKLLSGEGRAMLHMPTGSGKTRTAMNIIAHYLRNHLSSTVIWLAYSEELCEQAAEEFVKSWQFLGNREVCLHRFWGVYDVEKLDEVEDSFIVAGLPKMVSKAKSSIEFMQNLSKHCSLVVIDEAHQAVAPTYSVVLDLLAPEYKDKTHLLGLTATPGRTWSDMDADEKLAKFFKYKKHTLEVPNFSNPVDFLVSEGYLAKVEFEPLFYNFGMDLAQPDIERIRESTDLPTNILEQIADDAQRNMLIIDKVIELAKQANRIIVFAAAAKHSVLLSAMLQYKGINAKSVTAKTSLQDRTAIIEKFRASGDDCMVICNYAVLTTGFDAPKTNVAVIARPTNSLVLYSQMVGRAIRGVKAGGNKNAKVVTVVDKNLSGFGSVAEAFNNWNDVWS